MKVLADTCVWSLALRRERPTTRLSFEERLLKEALADAVRDGLAVMIGPIRQEVLSGIKEPAQFAKLSSTLEAFLDESIATSDYIQAARLFNLCRKRGLTCGQIDLLICAISIERQWKILTNDQALLQCLAAIRAEPTDFAEV